MKKNRIGLMVLGAWLPLMTPALATVVNLDMDSAPTANGYAASSATTVEDITSVPGKLTMDLAAAKFGFFTLTIGDALGSGEIVSFGATIEFDTFSPKLFDQYFDWSGFDASTNTKYTTRVFFRSNLLTLQYAAGGEHNISATINDSQEHTFRVDVDKSTGVGTFYLDGVETGANFQVSESATSGVNRFRFGDGTNSGDGAHKEYWDNVFYSNEEVVPEPATMGLVAIGALMMLRRGGHQVQMH